MIEKEFLHYILIIFPILTTSGVTFNQSGSQWQHITCRPIIWFDFFVTIYNNVYTNEVHSVISEIHFWLICHGLNVLTPKLWPLVYHLCITYSYNKLKSCIFFKISVLEAFPDYSSVEWIFQITETSTYPMKSLLLILTFLLHGRVF